LQQEGGIVIDATDIKVQNRKLKRQARETTASLKQLSQSCFVFLRRLDDLMKTTKVELTTGKAIAHLANELELANDRIRYGSLGVDFRKDDKDKEWLRIKGLMH
jgi:glucose-6-phosphate-specific signal transduction histidine kinase